MKRDIASRLPSSPDLDMQTYQILFTQYNIYIYIMVIAFVSIVITTGVIYVLTYSKNHREYLFEKVHPNFFKKLIPSIQILDLMIIANKAAFITFVIVIINSLFFLYMHPRVSALPILE